MKNLIERWRILVMRHDGTFTFAQDARAPYAPIAFDSDTEAYEHIASQQYSNSQTGEHTIIKTLQWV